MNATDQPESGSKTCKTVLYLANTDWYLFNFRKNLLKRASQDGWHVRLACGEAGYTTALAEEGWPVETLPLNSKGSNPLRELGALYKVIRLFRKERPDVAHLFTLKCVLYGCLAAPFSRNTRFIGALTGMGYLFTSNRLSVRLLKQLVIAGLRLGLKVSRAHLIFQNEFDRQEFVEQKLLPLERTSVIRGSGVDCAIFNPEKRQPSSDGNLRLLFCGRLIEEKGIRDYLAATTRLKAEGWEFTSRIAGEPYPGNPSSLSEAEVDELRTHEDHEFLGHYADMPALLAMTDIVVLPTYYREGTPKVLLEAMAAGCIVVTTTIPACDDLVEEGVNGFRISPKDVDSLNHALAKLLKCPPEQRANMSVASTRIARERFSDTQVNRATLNLYMPDSVTATT
ncbi:glycosyltransferase family 4 protein [uncultured Salinisphaera sp.]|uniref:glycosyltransferase family 4 protein n=1 Tax=uncultured Salinisphaera sp. TaxID=359372 RepID=UPI0032B1E316